MKEIKMGQIERAEQNKGQIIENVLVHGDLKSLTPEQRTDYYLKVCSSVGLNPMTKPFEYITLNGKLTLYARKDATDQLRSLRGVSISLTEGKTVNDVYVVNAKAKDKDGREDESTGAVSIAGLRGESLANSFMKAETKAKRRVTLSICGLGLLDESEIESIPAVQKQEHEDRKPSGPAVEIRAATGKTSGIANIKVKIPAPLDKQLSNTVDQEDLTEIVDLMRTSKTLGWNQTGLLKYIKLRFGKDRFGMLTRDEYGALWAVIVCQNHIEAMQAANPDKPAPRLSDLPGLSKLPEWEKEMAALDREPGSDD